MDIVNTKALLALAISGAMSTATAPANEVTNKVTSNYDSENSIIAVSSPDLRVTVYDGIATIIGTATSGKEAQLAEDQISDIKGVEHVINMITWG